MPIRTTLTQLRAMKLDGMAAALEQQLAIAESAKVCFETRLELLVEREFSLREDQRLRRLLYKAKLKDKASLEDLDTRTGRGLDIKLLASLADGDWISGGQSVLICGATGLGKTWLTCALTDRACKLGKTAYYTRLSRLLGELRLARADGTRKRRLLALAKLDVLALDDWGMHSVDEPGREDLTEIIDDRVGRHGTIIAAQLPAERWAAWIGDATVAEAILDRICNRAHRISLRGESLRRQRPVDVSISLQQRM